MLSLTSAILYGQQPTPAAAPAQIKVRLPADAKLTVGDYETKATGSERSFDSPPLTPGKVFTYTFRATWTENGKPVSQERTVKVEAGKQAEVDFTKPPPPPPPVPNPAPNSQAKSRDFLFTYTATVTDVEPGKQVRIWLPVPPSNDEQKVSIVEEKLPSEGKIGQEPKYGNKILYVETKAPADGTVPVSVTYRVHRNEVKSSMAAKGIANDDPSLFLKPDAKVPIGGKPLTLLEGKKLPTDQVQIGQVLYDVVYDHMRYSKDGEGWGQGDANWACDSKFGNCTDFHSLFISLARSNKIPAKFEMGFPLPTARGKGDVAGYHCWAKFKPQGKDWIPVDISEADKDPKMKDYYFGNLTEDRVAFSVGRDITLTPKQDGPPLNFFVYPYVEVDGKPYAKVTRKFGYEDVK
jgi:uncharacterized protein (TIGR03000 family)